MKKLVKTALCLLLCALLPLPALAEVTAASNPLTNGAYATSGDYTYTLLEDGGARIVFEDAVRAPARGQSAVFYDNDIVIGGGFIC